MTSSSMSDDSSVSVYLFIQYADVLVLNLLKMLRLPLKLYSEQERTQLTLVNWMPDLGENKYVEVCPKKQFVRLMFAGYLVYLIFTLF